MKHLRLNDKINSRRKLFKKEQENDSRPLLICHLKSMYARINCCKMIYDDSFEQYELSGGTECPNKAHALYSFFYNEFKVDVNVPKRQETQIEKKYFCE